MRFRPNMIDTENPDGHGIPANVRLRARTRSLFDNFFSENVCMNGLVRLTSWLLGIRSTWLVAIITFSWVSATTWTRPLMLPDEGRYVGVAWGMLKAGHDWVPRRSEERRGGKECGSPCRSRGAR